MIRFICVSAIGTVFSMYLSPVTNKQALQARLAANETPSPDLLSSATKDPDGTHWPALWGKARDVAEGCSIYTESMWQGYDGDRRGYYH